MKKKTVVLMVVFTLLLCGVAVGGVNGYFAGYPIVNVNVDGKTVTGDTPAINFNGRTMVPLAFVGQALGANVTWDSTTETAVVSKGGTASSSEDIARIKLYSQISAQYSDLELLGEKLIRVNDGLYIAGNNFLLNGDLSSYNEGLTRFLIIKDEYNKIKQNNDSFVADARNAGVDISKTVSILNSFGLAIKHYSLAYSDFNTWASFNYSQVAFDSMLNNKQKGLNFSLNARNDANAEGFYYYKLVQNY